MAGRGSIEGSGGVIRQEERNKVRPTMLMLVCVRERLQRMFRAF